MLRVDGEYISLTRGDTAVLDCDLETVLADGTMAAYDATGCKAAFSVRETFDSEEAIVSRAATVSEDGHTVTARLLPADTSSLEYGTYVCDFQLTTTAGEVYTPFVGRLRLTGEVTMA